jgi:hypothetical protein
MPDPHRDVEPIDLGEACWWTWEGKNLIITGGDGKRYRFLDMRRPPFEIDKIFEGTVVDKVPGQNVAEFLPLLKVADDNFLTCGALVNMGLMGKRVRVTVEVYDEDPTPA